MPEVFVFIFVFVILSLFTLSLREKQVPEDVAATFSPKGELKIFLASHRQRSGLTGSYPQSVPRMRFMMKKAPRRTREQK